MIVLKMFDWRLFWFVKISFLQLKLVDDSQDNEYIIFLKLSMFDLYQAIVPAISIITVLSLIALKLALKDNVTLSKIYSKRQTLQSMSSQIRRQESAEIKSLLKFLLLNFTPIQIFAVRRARYKLAFFLVISITLLATYFLQSPYFLSPIGTVVYLAYFLIAMPAQREDNQENQQQSTTQRQKYMQIIFSIAIVTLNMLAIRLVFKNYQNSILLSYLTNAAINIALDNFLVKPLLLIVVGLPLSRSSRIVGYAISCQKDLSLLQIYDQIGDKKMLIKPQKMLSASKVASKIPLNHQIEPVPFSQQPLMKRQEEGVRKAIQVLKKIKRQKLLPPINMNLQSNLECQLSLNSLFNSSKKQQDSQVDQLQEQRIEEKPYLEQDLQLPIKNNLCSQNLIMVNPSRHEQAENQEAIGAEQTIKEKISEQCEISFRNHYEEPAEQINSYSLNKAEEFNEPAKASIHASQQPTSRQQSLRIFLNGDMNLNLQESQHEEEQVETDNYRKRKELNTIDQNANKNSFGVLQIKEQNHCHRPSSQIQQINLNSPEKKRVQRIHIQLEDDSKAGVVKRKKKKFSHDQNHNRVIKFSTGQPYLQYLPHMLAKDNKGKKSQAINKKDVIVDSRATNSVKRPKKRFNALENNQNVPEFRIEDL